MPAFIDLTGKKFGRWTVIERDFSSNSNNIKYICKCDCGVISSVFANQLRTGGSKSCGCYNREATGNRSRTHGKTKTRLYSIWINMRQRCNNKRDTEYKNYGGRGIKICNEWDDFENFYNWSMENGYTDDLTIDRIDNDGNYCPENCRWTTWDEQARNKTNNIYITFQSKTMVSEDWEKEVGIPANVIRYRIKNGWDVENALTKKIERDYITYNGETKTISGWSKEVGISTQTIKRRLDSGWPIEKALYTKTSKANRIKSIMSPTKAP